ncbi:hypothetical protein LCGC14_3019050, partial [marine sediment metagenome]
LADDGVEPIRRTYLMEDYLRDPAPKTDICPLCQKSGHDV